jgi:hypothetical protein
MKSVTYLLDEYILLTRVRMCSMIHSLGVSFLRPDSHFPSFPETFKE